MTKQTLFKHQKQTVGFCRKNDRVFDMSEPGTGKTIAHITSFAEWHEKHRKSALVLGPKSILQSAWGNDIDKVANHLKYNVAYAENRKDAFDDPADIYITNIDAVLWLLKQPAKFFARFGYLVIDESTAYKHHTSQRSKAVDKLKKHFGTRRILSGLPNPNGICDVWHQTKILDDGRRLGNSFFAFRSAVCTPVQVGPSAQHLRWEDKESAELVVMGLLNDITIRHELRKCIDMPENHTYSMEYRLSAKHMALYRRMEDVALLELAGKRVTAVNGGVLYNKLLQIASGAVYDENHDYVLADSGRYEMVADLVEQRRHSLVFFQWQHQKDELIKEFNARGITFEVIDGSVTSGKKRSEIEQHFQRGFYRCLLLHPQSTAHGLTLTRATTAIWASPTINYEWWKQGNHRHDRAGQTERTETIVLVAPGTKDVQVYENCMLKGERAYKLLDNM